MTAAKQIEQAIDAALALAQTGRYDDAMQILEVGLEANAVDGLEQRVQAWHLLGLLRQELGQLAQAQAAFEQALDLDGQAVLVLMSLGELLLAQQQGAGAQAIWLRALEAAPATGRVWLGLADAQRQQSLWTEAIASCTQAVALRDESLLAAYNNRSMLYAQQGYVAQARADAAAAHALAPELTGPKTQMALAAFVAGAFEEAVAWCDQVLAQDTQVLAAWVLKTQALVKLGQYAPALLVAQQAWVLAVAQERIPVQVQVLEQQVIAYYYQSDFERMDRALERLQALDKSAKAQWLRCMTRITILPESRAQARAARRAFRQEWAYLEDSLEKNGDQGLGWQKLCEGVSHFYYIYHAINDLEILQGLGRVGARWMQAAMQTVLGDTPNEQSKQNGDGRGRGRLRVGVLSYQIKQHSIWWAMLQGLYAHAPEDIEIHTFSLGSYEDEQTAFAREKSSFFMGGIYALEEWVQAIRAQKLDVLYYPEVGLGAMTYRLACLRLAPVQFTSWGNPQTSGLPHMDYFLSARVFEAVENEPSASSASSAQEAYSEQVALLQSFPSCYARYQGEVQAFDGSDWGLDFSKKILLCSGSAFKYPYDAAAMYAEIAARSQEEGTQLVFFEDDPHIFGLLQVRLQQAFADRGVAQQLVFCPWLNRAQYQYLMKQSYLLLDSLGFSGFNTVLQALDVGLPVVTARGDLLRGRLGSGALDAVGMDIWVAESQEAYIALAVQLVQDAPLRQRYVEAIASQASVLFDNRSSVDETFACIRQWASTTIAQVEQERQFLG
jgi:predicted O-linked N-acetylglucosamine transferase (SPINDLY family)